MELKWDPTCRYGVRQARVHIIQASPTVVEELANLRQVAGGQVARVTYSLPPPVGKLDTPDQFFDRIYDYRHGVPVFHPTGRERLAAHLTI